MSNLLTEGSWQIYIPSQCILDMLLFHYRMPEATEGQHPNINNRVLSVIHDCYLRSTGSETQRFSILFPAYLSETKTQLQIFTADFL
jgi:hypothetical protein